MPAAPVPPRDGALDRRVANGMTSFGTGSGFSRRIERVVRMISNRSVFIV
jgi:hypothetical protein